MLVLNVVGDMAVDCHTPDIATLEGCVLWVVYRNTTISGLIRPWRYKAHGRGTLYGAKPN